MDRDDWELLQDYVQNGSELAFETIVQRYLNQVFAMALRQTGDAHLAQDVAQAVFVVLVRKARTIPPGTVLPGWLFNTTRYVAQTLQRTERRRLERETNAMHDPTLSASESENLWEQLSPHLDNAMASLRERDREVVLLRFFRQQSVRQVSQMLGLSEDAVQKRTSRAVERLRHYFTHRGIGVSTASLLGILTLKVVQEAPAELVPAVMAVINNPAGAAPALLAAADSAGQMLATSKLTLAAVLGSTALVALLPLGGWWLASRADEPLVFSLNRDFSLASNPHGAWSFGAKESPEGPLTLSSFREITARNEECWAFRSGTWPAVYRNSSTNVLRGSGGYFPPGSIWYGPGDDGTPRHYGAIRFTTPPQHGGRYRLETLAESALPPTRSSDADFLVVHNGVLLFSNVVDRGQPAWGYTNELVLKAGDTVDFLAGRGPDSLHRGSVLKIQASLSLLQQSGK